MPGGSLTEPALRRIYLLDPGQYSPETIAVAFAKTSRSPLSFDEIAADLNAEKSADFNEKWVVGYGHASVAEHAVLHIAIENISRLAVETIEANRLASYTEKSTRYQNWDQQAFYTPAELDGHPIAQEYQDTCSALFNLYRDCQPLLQTQKAQECPQQPGESNEAFKHRLRSSALDVARYLLPAASLANLGMTANARMLEHAISKMLSSPLEEVLQIGKTVKETACTSVPTLIKYAVANEYQRTLADRMVENILPLDEVARSGDWLSLIDFNPLGVERILASLLFRYGTRDYGNYLEHITSLTSLEKKALLDSILTGLGLHDILPHEFEHTTYTFDVTMDQGAFYEVKRHRMMTQSPQALGADLRFATPRLMVDCGLLKHYQAVMDRAAACWKRLADWNPAVASYIVPNGFQRRVLLSMNAREAFTFIKLRSSPNAHFAVRRVACRMAEEIHKAHPLFEGLFSSACGETWQSIEQNYL
jgi:thymidylate synthase ThyX